MRDLALITPYGEYRDCGDDRKVEMYPNHYDGGEAAGSRVTAAPHITTLTVASARMAEGVVKDLARMLPRLVNLDLNSCRFQGAGLRELQPMSGLRSSIITIYPNASSVEGVSPEPHED